MKIDLHPNSAWWKFHPVEIQLVKCPTQEAQSLLAIAKAKEMGMSMVVRHSDDQMLLLYYSIVVVFEG